MAAERREASLVGAELCLASRDIGSRFRRPDDDWAPVCMVWRDGAVRGLFNVPIPSLDGDGIAIREGLFRHVVPQVIQELGGTAAALVTSNWEVVSTTIEEAAMVEAWSRAGRSLEDLPNRIEMLVVTAADVEGLVCWKARIVRDGQAPPTLGEWVLWEGTLDGRLSDGLLKGVGAKGV